MLVVPEYILSVIPQRPPFVMVDALTAIDETGFYTEFSVREDNVLTDNGCLSEAGLMENIAQTAAAGAGYKTQKNGDEVLTGFIGAVKNFEIAELPKIGSLIYTKVTTLSTVFDVTVIEGEVICNEKIIARCEMKIFLKLP